MKSLRETAKSGGVTGPLPGVRALGQRFGLTPPFTVQQLMGAMGAKPAGPTEEAKFSQQVITPTGTALGGTVDLTLRSDGTYKAHFHMHDSGFPNYAYQVRALFTAKDGLVFALQQSGRVEGTASGLNPRRDDDHDVVGFHPFIRDHWPAVKAGSFAVSKDYSATG